MMQEEVSTTELEAVQLLLTTLNRFDGSTRARILRTIEAFFGLDERQAPGIIRNTDTNQMGGGPVGQSADRQVTPKEFLFDKKPQTNVERVAVLAYYLTHYRDQSYFKTLDLSKLNTEAAQPKFTNAAYATNDALKAGLLAQATKGQRQISALGEQFVLALPDRDSARAVLAARGRKRVKRRGASTVSSTEEMEVSE